MMRRTQRPQSSTKSSPFGSVGHHTALLIRMNEPGPRYSGRLSKSDRGSSELSGNEVVIMRSSGWKLEKSVWSTQKTYYLLSLFLSKR
jgi:hypothetical protein